MKLLVSNVTDYAILMVDPKGFIIEWTEGAERVTGYEAHEVIGQHLSLVYPPEEGGRCAPAIRRAAEDCARKRTDPAIFTTNEQNVITSWNTGAYNLFDYTEEEAIGQPADIIFTREDRYSGQPQKEIEGALRDENCGR